MNSSMKRKRDDDIFADITKMVEVVKEDFNDRKVDNLFQRVFEDAEKLLYEGCIDFTKISVLLDLYNVKSVDNKLDLFTYYYF